jgi:hypothetical protein
MRMRFLLVRWRSSYGNACRRPHFQLASRKRLLHDSKALWRCPAQHQNGRCSRNIFAKAPMVNDDFDDCGPRCRPLLGHVTDL